MAQLYLSASLRPAGFQRKGFDQPQVGGSQSCLRHFRPLSALGDALVGYGAGSISGQEKAVGTFARLVARYGLKNVPTHVEIMAELPACHAGAVINLWVCAKLRQAKAREPGAEWRLRRQPHEGALVAVYVGRALLLVRLSYRIEWNFPRALSDAVRHLN